MTRAVRERHEIPKQYTWDVESVFASDADWQTALESVESRLPSLQDFQGHLSDGPDSIVDWFSALDETMRTAGQVFLYASMRHNVDTGDPAAKAMQDRASALLARVAAATAFAEPELLALDTEKLHGWLNDDQRLAVYSHYVDSLERRGAHVRSADVEATLGLVREPFSAASSIHRVLTDTDLAFTPARTSSGEEVPVAQGNLNALLSDADRELRRSAWESYSDAHLALKNTMASCLAAGVKQDVFMARVRRYSSSLQAALEPNHIPVEVFHNLIDTYRRSLPIWHRYWRVRREALGVDALQVYDIKAPLFPDPAAVPYDQAVRWIVDGMRPLGDEYVAALQRGATEERWVDVYPNLRKRSGAYSSGAPGTRPFILMSYNDDIFSLSTLAHELGHSLHSYFTRQTQPMVYMRYGLFVAEVASNFNQALVRARLFDEVADRNFQIALIEEAMSNFHRYFFIMPALARFELEIHQRVERGEGLTAEGLIDLMADLFAEGYGDEVVIDRDRIGITWAQFSGHLYANFYVYQYATGISAANALAKRVLEEGQPAAERYLSFLRAGGSLYPLDALQLAGVDMRSPEPVENAFAVLSSLVDRLAELLGVGKAPAAS